MAESRIYRLKIDAYTPETMPMARLAEYMADLAVILGEPPAVHFVELEASSTVLVHRVDAEAVPKVQERVARTRNGEGPADAMAGVRRLNSKLRADAGVATLLEETAEVLPFPGREAAIPLMFPAFNQTGTLDGTVIRVGGRGAVVPVHLDAGTVIYSKCEANRALAKRLAAHIFTGEVRVHGLGRWYVDEGGTWLLDKFTINHFEPLDDTPLTSVVEALRAIPTPEWGAIADPWADLNNMRREVDEPA